MDRLRAAEEGLESHQAAAQSAAADHASTSETLTAENFQLRETVGKQNAAIVADGDSGLLFDTPEECVSAVRARLVGYCVFTSGLGA